MVLVPFLLHPEKEESTMFFRKLTLATATASLAAMPVAAQAAQAAPSRASAPAADESELGGSDLMRALIIVIIGAIGMGVLLLSDDDAPVSP
jgi:hypothetical protein